MRKSPGSRKTSGGSLGKKKNISVDKAEQMDRLQAYVRSDGAAFLNDPNINSVGIGYKIKDGKPTKELCIQFTVGRKLAENRLESVGTTSIPKVIKIGDMEIATDVVERKFHAGYDILEVEAKSERKRRLATLVPGISVSHPSGTAGTLGTIVFDVHDGQACMLSNWHVLHTPNGDLGDAVVQPGPFDDNQVDENRAGVLVRSHLGSAGDCAIARIVGRGFDQNILDLNTKAARFARPSLGDKVVKSGRTTGVTYGVVTRIDTITKINYGGSFGEQKIGGFEIGPDPDRPAEDNEVSMGGDSGSIWLIAGKDGEATDIMVGLHFAGEGKDDPDEHAMACYAHSVFQKLEIALEPPALPSKAVDEASMAVGYVTNFLGVAVPEPSLTGSIAQDVVLLNGSSIIPYTHFSVCLSKSRRVAYYVAWNIDGGQIKQLSRKGLNFVLDSRIDKKYQIGNEAYSDNKLDRGHLARRADLCWGALTEAKKANRDSFCFTNITPQHQAFNQSERHGLWGRLENAILDDVDVENLKVSVIAGPILKANDLEYRGIKIPRAFWKLIAFVEDGELKVKAYVLSQDNLLDDIEALDLDPFRLWQVSLSDLEDLTRLGFNSMSEHDTFVEAAERIAAARPAHGRMVREIFSRADLIR